MAFAKTPKQIRIAVLSVHFENGLKHQVKKIRNFQFPAQRHFSAWAVNCQRILTLVYGGTSNRWTTWTNKPNTPVKESDLFMSMKPVRSADGQNSISPYFFSQKPKMLIILFQYTNVYLGYVVQPSIFAFSCSLVSQSLASVYNPAEHKICAVPITRNVGQHSWFAYGFLLSAYATPVFSCSIGWNWSSHWYWWLPCATACPVLQDIDCQVAAWKFRCPFSPFSFIPRQGNYWEINVSAGRILLHLKSAIWHRSATRFSNSQGGMKTLDDEHFGCHPLCMIFFICSDHVWNQSHWSQEYHSSPHSAK